MNKPITKTISHNNIQSLLVNIGLLAKKMELKTYYLYSCEYVWYRYKEEYVCHLVFKYGSTS